MKDWSNEREILVRWQREIYEPLGFRCALRMEGLSDEWEGPVLRVWNPWLMPGESDYCVSDVWWDKTAQQGAQYLSVNEDGIGVATGCGSSAGDLALRLAARAGLIVKRNGERIER